MPRLELRQAPPPDYYAGNLEFLLDEVARRNGDLLVADERALIDGWRAASIPARRLLARLLTRKGPWIRVDRLAYPEVPDSAATLAELQRLKLLEVEPRAPADRLLDLFTRRELHALFPRVRASTKAAWVQDCVARYPDTRVRARVASRYSWIALICSDAFAVCRLLFFGSDRQDLTEFVLHDLGLQRFETYEIGARTRPFGSRAELDRYCGCRRLAAWVAAAEHDREVAAIVRRHLWGPAESRTVARLRDRLLNRLGHLHERRGEYDEALESYALSTSHPARERRARLLQRLGDACGARTLLEGALAAPWSAEEEDYALRSLGSGSGATHSGFTVTEAPLTTAELTHLRGGSIECHALHALSVAGGSGWHVENQFPLGLAGLLFWDDIFAPVPGAFSHPFQGGPRDLFWPDFARVRARSIDARAAALCDPAAFRGRLAAVFQAKQGTVNHLVHWGVWTPDLVAAVLCLNDTRLLLDLARHVIADLQRVRTGFPDLLIVRSPDDFEFVEVKAPSDQLQPAQRTWLRTLGRLGLSARVLKFRLCP